jgi:LysR family transcriptional regulator (chromosome initiation inhibitor)
MLDYAQLETLATVHRRGSFDLAAAQLGLTPSAVSQRIKALEERIGALLIRRGVPCVATETGLRLIRHFDEVSLMEATLPVPDARPRTLRIAVNADSLATWVIPALVQVPEVLFDLVIDDQDHSQDWLRRGEVVAAVTSHPGPLQGCDTVFLGHLRYLATASPAFTARWFCDGVTQNSLSRAPALSFSDKDRLQTDWIAQVTGARFPYPWHRIASSHGFVDAALAGMGWGMNPEPLIRPHLARGVLVEIAPGTPLDVPLHWQFTRLAAPFLARLTKAICAGASRGLIV